MKCDVCGRHEASALVTMIVNGKKAVRKVCKQCIARMQRGDAYATQMAILSSFEPPEQEIYCPVCNTAWSQVLKCGRVGCASCYQAFDTLLQPLLVHLNGAAQQSEDANGAAASEPVEKNEISRLREEMFAAVNAEEYERAAQLRDRIRSLEQAAGEARE